MAVTIPRSDLSTPSLPSGPATPVPGGDAAAAASAAFDALLDTEQKATGDGPGTGRDDVANGDPGVDRTLPDVQLPRWPFSKFHHRGGVSPDVSAGDQQGATDDPQNTDAVPFFSTRWQGDSMHARRTAAADDDEQAVDRHSSSTDDDQQVASALPTLANVVPSAAPPVRDERSDSNDPQISQAGTDSSASLSSADLDPEGRRSEASVPRGIVTQPWVPDWSGNDEVTGGTQGNIGDAAAGMDVASGVSSARRHRSDKGTADPVGVQGLADKPSPSPLPSGTTLAAGQLGLASRATPGSLVARALLERRVSEAGPAVDRVPTAAVDPKDAASDPSDSNRAAHAAPRVTATPGAVRLDVDVNAQPNATAAPSIGSTAASARANDRFAPSSPSAHLDPDLVVQRTPSNGPATAMIATPLTHGTGERAGLVMAAAAASDSRPPLPDDASLASQIVQRMRLQWLGNGGTAVVNLDPGYLGNVTIHLNVGRDGATTATLSAANDDVRSWAQANEPLLRQQLAGQGLSLDRLDVVQEETRNAADQHDERQQRWKPPTAVQNARRKSSGTFEVVV